MYYRIPRFIFTYYTNIVLSYYFVDLFHLFCEDIFLYFLEFFVYIMFFDVHRINKLRVEM